MIKLLIIVALITLVVLFVRGLKNHLARDKKLSELEDARLETDLMDIDKEIAKEKALKESVSLEIDEINKSK